MPRYEHTQTSPLHLILSAVAAVLLIIAWFSRDPGPRLVLMAVAAVIMALALCFQRLTVRDEGTHLGIRYGPLPLFKFRIAYGQMTAVSAARSGWLDGWGIHYFPGRGIIYNLWGFDCVRVQMGAKTVRIGSDDVPGLVRFLRSRLGNAPGDHGSSGP